MSQFKFTNQRGISTVYSYLLKRLKMLNTFMIYRHTYIYIIYSIFIQLKKGTFRNLSKWKTWQPAAAAAARQASRLENEQKLQTATSAVERWESKREVREKWERRRAYCFELLKKSHDSSPRHPKVAQANKQTEKERESHKLTDLGEEKKSGRRKNGRKNYFISIKFNEKLHTAIAEG